MSSPLSAEDIKIYWSLDNQSYQELPGLQNYRLGLDCRTKEYQPADSKDVFDVKLGKKLSLNLDFIEEIDREFPQEFWVASIVFFNPNLGWVRQGKYQQMQVSRRASAGDINAHSLQLSLIGNLASYIGTKIITDKKSLLIKY